MDYKYNIFCCGEDAESSIAGVLETMIPLERGHIHEIKGRKWRCEYVGENGNDMMADFRPFKEV